MSCADERCGCPTESTYCQGLAMQSSLGSFVGVRVGGQNYPLMYCTHVGGIVDVVDISPSSIL